MSQTKVPFSMLSHSMLAVTDYGAVADGVADATAGIQTTMNLAAGRTVFFPNGSYKISDSLIVPSNTSVVFDAGVAINVAANTFTTNDAVLKIDKKNNITIHGNGVTITGQREGTGTSLLSYGVAISGSTNIRVLDVYCANFGGDGFIVKEADDLSVWYSENIWIERCRSTNAMRNGFTLASGSNVWINNCIASTSNGKSPECGFYVEPPASSARLINCNFINCIGTMNTAAQFKTVIGSTDPVISTDVDVVFDNCKVLGSTTVNMLGFDIGGHKSNMPNKGRLLLRDCVAKNTDSYGLLIHNIDKNGQNVTVTNFQAIDTNTGQRTTYGFNAPVSIHATSDTRWPNPGGIRIDGLKVYDTTADRTPYYINSAGTAHDDIHILNFEWINSIGKTTHPYMDDLTTDTLITWVPGPYNVSRTTDLTLSARYNGWIMDNNGATGTVIFPLPAVAAGLAFYFEVYAPFALRIKPTVNDTITPNGTGDGKYMESSEPGATAIVYANRSANNWIIERIGTWTDEP